MCIRDSVERGRELYQILAEGALGLVKPTSHLFDCRMVGFYPTATEPMKSLVARVKLAERGGGAPSDNVSLLAAMLEAKGKDAAFGGIWAPVAAQALAEAGIGARIPLR